MFGVFYCNNEKLANIAVISEQRPYWHWMEPDEINTDTLMKTVAFYENTEKVQVINPKMIFRQQNGTTLRFNYVC